MLRSWIWSIVANTSLLILNYSWGKSFQFVSTFTITRSTLDSKWIIHQITFKIAIISNSIKEMTTILIKQSFFPPEDNWIIVDFIQVDYVFSYFNKKIRHYSLYVKCATSFPPFCILQPAKIQRHEMPANNLHYLDLFNFPNNFLT